MFSLREVGPLAVLFFFFFFFFLLFWILDSMRHQIFEGVTKNKNKSHKCSRLKDRWICAISEESQELITTRRYRDKISKTNQ